MPWLKIKKATAYSGVGERTLRNWLENGLRHWRLPSGTILIKDSWIDDYIEQFQPKTNEVDEIVASLLRNFKGK
jgi:hypothetical protein